MTIFLLKNSSSFNFETSKTSKKAPSPDTPKYCFFRCKKLITPRIFFSFAVIALPRLLHHKKVKNNHNEYSIESKIVNL